MKKILKWTGISLGLIILSLVLIPLLFKNQIKALIIKEANTMLTAELSMGDFDLTLISSFPNLTLELIETKLTGKNEFENIDLITVKSLSAQIDLWDVITGNEIKINAIHFKDGSINVLVLENGLANYDIMKESDEIAPEATPETTEESFKLSLKKYSIENTNVFYSDKEGNMSANIININHIGSGDITSDVQKFNTTTTVDKITYEMDGIKYLNEVSSKMDINILIEFSENSSTFTLAENTISMNELIFGVDGFYALYEDYDEMDLKLNASKASFKQILSLIPTFYLSGYESMIASGDLKLNGFLKGKMYEDVLPAWDFRLNVSDASIKYVDLPGVISNISMSAISTFKGGENLDLMILNIPKAHAEFSKNYFDANLLLTHSMTDPHIESNIKANMNLATLGEFIPLTEGESYTGILDADVKIKGNISALENENYEKFEAHGGIRLQNMFYKSPDLPEAVMIHDLVFKFTPENLALEALNAEMGKSDFDFTGKIDNYFGYFLRDEKLHGTFTFNSNYLDLDALMPEETTTESTNTSQESIVTEEVLLIPKSLDIVLNSSIKKMKYNDFEIEAIAGKIILKDEIASLKDLSMSTMQGKIVMDGSYNTVDHKTPKIDFKYNLTNISIGQLAENFVTIEKIAPIAKLADGNISSKFTMTSDLTPALDPIFETTYILGDIRSKEVRLNNLELFDKIEKVTKLQNLSNQTLKDFRTKFEVKDGKIYVYPFDVKIGKYTSTVEGYTTLDQKMDYTFKMGVPKEDLPQSILNEIESKIKSFNKTIPGLKIESLPATIPVNLSAKGDFKNPKITSDLKESMVAITKGMTKNLTTDLKKKAVDTVKAIVSKQLDNVQIKLEQERAKIINDAEKEADNIKNEAKKGADIVRKEADKQADELVKQAGNNFIQKKLAEEGAKKLRAKAETQIIKAENEANTKADNLLKTATKKANNLNIEDFR